MCPYAFYRDNETYYPYLYCKLDGKRCLYSKRCQKEEKYIPLDNQGECYKMIENTKHNIPTNSFYVQNSRPSPNGTWLYVEFEGNVVKVEIKIKDYNKNYVYLKKKSDGSGVIASDEPFRRYGKKTSKKD